MTTYRAIFSLANANQHDIGQGCFAASQWAGDKYNKQFDIQTTAFYCADVNVNMLNYGLQKGLHRFENCTKTDLIDIALDISGNFPGVIISCVCASEDVVIKVFHVLNGIGYEEFVTTAPFSHEKHKKNSSYQGVRHAHFVNP